MRRLKSNAGINGRNGCVSCEKLGIHTRKYTGIEYKGTVSVTNTWLLILWSEYTI